MGHELDQTNDIVSFANSRNDAWHQLGQSVGHLMTATEVMAEAHLANWNVRKVPMHITTDPIISDEGVTPGEQIEVPNKWATVRTNPITGKTEPLGVVGNVYTPLQNEASTEMLDAMRDESSAAFETAGALRGGRETFVTMKLPEAMKFTSPITGKDDVTELYIAALNSHDGNSPFRFIVTPTRIVCANTQGMALRNAQASFSLRHTINAKNAINEARAALGLTFKYLEEFESAVQTMIAREMEGVQVIEIIHAVTGVDKAPTERAKNMRLEHAGQIMGLYRESDTVAPFKGTAFGVYNAVTEYADHFMKVGKKGDAADQRALRTITSDSVLDLKTNAYKQLTLV